MGKASRDKGSRREREFLRELGNWLGDDYPPLQRNLQQSRNGGADCIDIDGVSIEVKGCERFQSRWFDQAAEQADGGVPVVAWKQSRKPWRCFIEMSPAELASFIRERSND